ncbi:Pycsar system effector family protein [Streptomyces flavidovirens]|uniref:Pycsar system effector family protein n=1 Tax=Streptomyces flavidovirens TaxID=67298 RepID=UPI00367EBCEA
MSAEQPTTPADDRLNVNLTAAHSEVKAEIIRTDTKASLLLAFDGAILAAVWTAATSLHLPVTALVATAIGAALVVAAAALLLAVVRPRLGGANPVGFPRWATLTEDEIRADLRSDDRAQHIRNLSRIAVAKFTRLQTAVDLTRAAGAVFTLAALIALGGVLL